jgi:ABC-type multidrug transport system ATPase subunit
MRSKPVITARNVVKNFGEIKAVNNISFEVNAGEIFAFLGPTQTRNLLWDYVKKLSKTEGMTIFFTTHYLDEAEAVADRIAIIDHGKIIATGTAAQLTKQTGTKNLESAYLELTGKGVRDETSLGNNGLNVRTAMRNRNLR